MLRRSIEGARFKGGLFALNAEHQAKCERCGLPLAEVDAYGETISGSGGDPRTTHDYAPGTYTASLLLRGPGDCGDSDPASVLLSVPECGREDEAEGEDEGCGCPPGLFLVMALMLCLGVGLFILYIFFTACTLVPPLPAPPVPILIPPGVTDVLFWLSVALIGLVILGLFICFSMCIFGPCDCPWCQSLRLLWQGLLAGAITALFVSGCCTLGWWPWLVVGLFVAAGVFFAIWLASCARDRCDMYLSLAVAISMGGVATGWLLVDFPGIPDALHDAIMACAVTLVPWAAAIVTALLGVLALAEECRLEPSR